MEGWALRVKFPPDHSSPLSVRARFVKRGSTCCLRSPRARRRLSLWGLFAFCILVVDCADCSRPVRQDYGSDATSQHHVNPSDRFRKSLLPAARPQAIVGPFVDVGSLPTNTPVTGDGPLNHNAKFATGSNSQVRTTCEEHEDACGGTPVMVEKEESALLQDDLGTAAGTRAKWRDAIKRRWNQIRHALRKSGGENPSDNMGGEAGLYKMFPSVSPGSTSTYLNTHAHTEGDAGSACDKPQPRMGALLEPGSGFSEDTRQGRYPFPSAMHSTFKRYAEKMPLWLQDRALRWLTSAEEGPTWQPTLPVGHFGLLGYEDDELVHDEGIRSLGEAARRAARRRKAKYSDKPLFDEGIDVRSQLSDAVYKLTLQERLGSGSGGVVFAAEAENYNRSTDVAVKIIYKKDVLDTTDETLEERFLCKILRETAILYHMPVGADSVTASRRMHVAFPLDIVAAFDSRRCPGSVGTTVYSCIWIVMEKYSSNLHGIIHHYFSPQDLLSMTRQMIMSVASTHSMRLLHNDIKLGNFLVSAAGSIYLGDFGMSTAADSDGLCHMGTMPYMAPERLKCMTGGLRRMRLTAKQDSWSLGISLFYLWCNHQHPFLDRNKASPDIPKRMIAAGYWDAIQKSTLDFSRCPHSVPAVVEEVIRALLSFEKETRATPSDIYLNSALFRKPTTDLVDRSSDMEGETYTAFL